MSCECQCECEYEPEFDDFIKSIRFNELCIAAANLRGGISCELGKQIIGGKHAVIFELLTVPIGFNVVYELLFSDNVAWMARIPLAYSCGQPDELYAQKANQLFMKVSIPLIEALFPLRWIGTRLLQS